MQMFRATFICIFSLVIGNEMNLFDLFSNYKYTFVVRRPTSDVRGSKKAALKGHRGLPRKTSAKRAPYRKVFYLHRKYCGLGFNMLNMYYTNFENDLYIEILVKTFLLSEGEIKKFLE